MKKEEIIELALEGQAIAFIGSGFSVGARNFTKKGEFLVGKELCDALIEDGKIDVDGESDSDKADLQYIATRYLEINTRRDLLKLLKNIYCCQSVGEEHIEIASIPWKKIYTTNYDDVMEEASKRAFQNREALVATSKIGEVYCRKDAIIHINGYINNVTEDDLEDTFKLTQASYRSRTLSESDWTVALHTDIKNAQAVIFIGYSLDYDLELQQIFACDEGLKEKCLFVDYNPSRRKLTCMKNFGSVFGDGVKEFGKFVGNIKNNVNTSEKPYMFKCLMPDHIPERTAIEVASNDLIRLFVDGEVKREILYSALEKEYVFARTCNDQIFDFITGTGKAVIIHSDLSNGKSIIAQQLMIRLRSVGKVYNILENVDSQLADDLEYIATQKGMHYIFVENYNQLIDSDAWNVVCNYRYSNIKYVFTARSYINDNFYSRIIRGLELTYESLGMYDVNELKEDDIKKFAALIAKYGLWGEKYASGISAQRKFIERKCKAEIRNVLLELYKSPVVTSKIDSIVKCIVEDDLSRKVLLFSFICNILSVPIEIDDMAIVLGINNVSKLFFDRYKELKELILLDGNKLRIKSSNIASYIIQDQNYNDEILSIINSIVNCYCKHCYNPKYANILKYIISFSNLRLIFNRNDSNIKDKYISFYENARKTGYYKDNQFFWIQYAIAVMDVEDYDAAEVYLKNASALSQKKINEDSYQVDSLRARLMLERTIFNNDKEHAFDNFRAAHKLICSNKTPERHYPYRQVSHYIDFYKKFYNDFSQENKVSFMLMCTEIQEKINIYLNQNNDYEKNTRKRNNYIKRIEKDLQDIISKMTWE